MRIACRWPGGMDILIPKTRYVVHLNGPRGVPTIQSILGRSAPSLRVATAAQKAVADTIKRLESTKDGPYASNEYGVTDVPDHLWNAWHAAHVEMDAVKLNMVFPA